MNELINQQRDEIEALKAQLVEVTNGATGQTPCSKYCEARAVGIEIRNLRAENKRNNELLSECWNMVGNDIDFEHGGFSTICEHVNAQREALAAAEQRVKELELVAVMAAKQAFMLASKESLDKFKATNNQTASSIRIFEYHLERCAMSAAKHCVDEQLRAKGGE